MLVALGGGDSPFSWVRFVLKPHFVSLFDRLLADVWPARALPPVLRTRERRRPAVFPAEKPRISILTSVAT